MQNQPTLSTVIQTQKHKESQQKELHQFLTDWIVENLQPLYVIQSLSFHRLIGKLDSAFIIPDEKGIKKVIYSAYDSMLPALINKININVKSVIRGIVYKFASA